MRKSIDENFVCERCGVPFPEVGRGAYIEGRIVCLECKKAWDACRARFFGKAEQLVGSIYDADWIKVDHYTGGKIRVSRFIKGKWYDSYCELPANVTEVVRCKDCKQWSRNSGIAESPNGHCFCHDIDTNGHDFCSYGERRNE